MYQVFKSLIVSDIVCRDIDLYGGIVVFNRRLSHDIVRKRLANCFVYVRKHDKDEDINGHYFYRGRTSHWLGYLLHRDNDKPAHIDGDEQIWYQYSKRHRDNDKPALIYGDYQVWYQYGELHRDNDKPAIVGSSKKYWYQHGKRYYPDL